MESPSYVKGDVPPGRSKELELEEVEKEEGQELGEGAAAPEVEPPPLQTSEDNVSGLRRFPYMAVLTHF